MTIENKLTLFMDLIICNYNLYVWSYTPDLTLLNTNCPEELIYSDINSFQSTYDPLLHYAKDGYYPFIMDTPLGILWIADFERKDGILQKIHMIGPAFTGKHSYHHLKKELDQRNLSIKIKTKIFQQLDNIPIVPTNILYQYAIMLHYCLTEERITSQDMQYPAKSKNETETDIKRISEEHRGIWMAEQSLVKMLREGNPNYKTALVKSSLLSNGIKFDVGDSIRQKKSSVLVLLTLCSRASIEGGLSPSISFTLCDHYTQAIEQATTITELTDICRIMLDDYIKRVNLAKENTEISKQIQDCCDYIRMHLNEKISIEFLAKRAGYTEYYFSRKFKKEMGCNVNDFIKNEKVEQAKLLLCSSKLSIQEISDELSFCTRSYFSDLFKKITGISPSEYREQNFKQ